ncbi:hypothetical protein [Paenibacillus polymyxa]|uniref:hypothetical protein n=1 Tax=Paenibacillus polymyxa TaxID=1406 RepID=UPI0039BD755D
MKIKTSQITCDPKVVRTENGGFNTIKGTGTKLFLEYGENESGIQEFKRVLDSEKNIVGQFFTCKQEGYIGETQYTDLLTWMRGINAAVGCKVF